MADQRCVNCDGGPVRRNRRCALCANYLHRTGKERPLHLLRAQAERMMASG